jgi:hypothetical protein
MGAVTPGAAGMGVSPSNPGSEAAPTEKTPLAVGPTALKDKFTSDFKLITSNG